MNNKNRLLVLAPHTDDGELGCGGTIAKLVETGKEVHYIAFSNCEKSLPPGLSPNTLVDELARAMAELGVPESNVHVEAFEVRCFERDRQEILDAVIRLGNDIHPDLVLMPSPGDLHQDHVTIAMEALRAFKRSASIVGYELPWNNLVFSTTCFVPLTDRQIEKKIRAVGCYESQRDRFYTAPEFVQSWARTRGGQIGVKYAETFEVLRWIVT